MSEEQNLVRASLAGDCRAFERLVEKYQSLICAITFSATGRVDASEELAQETFLQAWKNLFQLKDIDKFRSWLCSIARNLIQTHYRQKHANKVAVCDTDTLELLAAQACPSSAEIAIGREEEMILSHALMQLPEEYREPLVLFYRQHQSTKEVAQSLDMNEATVRTRLSRGRQMLKDKVSAMVERTLEKTGPGKQFTKAVMVSIGAGLAAGTAATAAGTAAGTLAAGGTTSAATVTGFLTAAGIKIAAIAAAVIIGTGAVVYHYWNPADSAEPVTQAAVIEPAKEQDLQEMTSSDSPALAHAVNADAQEAALENKAQDVPVQASPAPIPAAIPQSIVAHPDWPGIDEPVSFIYTNTKTIDINGKENTQNFWARLPDAFRDEGLFNKITVDNGNQRLVLDPNTKQAQIEPSWYRNGKMIWQYQQSLNEHPSVTMAAILRDPNSNPECILTKLTTESDEMTTVYSVNYKEMNNPDGIQIKMWADNRTLLPEKIQAIITGEPNQFDNMTDMLMLFDFSPISDNLFSIDIPAGYNALPAKQPKGFSGHVIDMLGNPVAGAVVYLDCRAFGSRNPYMATSDTNGFFNVILPQNEYELYFTASLWAILPDNPDFIAWTLLRSPQDLKNYPVLGGTVPGSPGIIYPSEDYHVETTDKGTVTYGTWGAGATDIVLIMETGITISGFVSDIYQKPVSRAIIDVKVSDLTDPLGNQIPSIHYMPPAGVLRTLTNQQGYYEIRNFPKLWKTCEMLVDATPPAGQHFVADEKRIKISDPNQPIQADFVLLPQGPTVRGIVTDNYGTPLPGRTVSALVDGKYFPGYGANTDKDGRFEFKHCPADKDLEIIATLSSRIYNYNGKETGQEYYPDVTVHVGYQPGQDEYEVKLVAIKPEIEIEALLVDSAGNPLPYFPVEIRADESLPTQWVVEQGFHQRTDAHGTIKFTQVPQMKALRLACSWVLEPTIYDKTQTPEMQEYFKQLQQGYQQYHWTESEVPLVPGQKKYQMTITIPTEEEYKQQKELEKSSRNTEAN